MDIIEQRKFSVVQTQDGFRNKLGEMTETEVYAHVRTRLGYDANAAEVALNELEQRGVFKARFAESSRGEFTMEIRRL
jgi:hypothetical protein